MYKFNKKNWISLISFNILVVVAFLTSITIFCCATLDAQTTNALFYFFNITIYSSLVCCIVTSVIAIWNNKKHLINDKLINIVAYMSSISSSCYLLICIIEWICYAVEQYNVCIVFNYFLYIVPAFLFTSFIIGVVVLIRKNKSKKSKNKQVCIYTHHND